MKAFDSIMKGLNGVNAKLYDLVNNEGDLTQKLEIKSGDELELIARRVINDLENKNSSATPTDGGNNASPLQISEEKLRAYATTGSKEYNAMVEEIAKRLCIDTLQFTKIETIIEAIGLPKCKVCTHCFDGSSSHTL